MFHGLGKKKVSIYIFLVPILYNAIFRRKSFLQLIAMVTTLVAYFLRSSILAMNSVQSARSSFSCVGPIGQFFTALKNIIMQYALCYYFVVVTLHPTRWKYFFAMPCASV